MNPDHLYDGTFSDNMRDRLRRDRVPGVLGISAVSQIKELLAEGLPVAEIARRVGCTATNVSHIKIGHTYSYI